MYFGGVGWVRFEPTPQARTGRGVPGYTTQQVPQAAPSGSASSAPSAAPTVDPVDRAAEQQASEDAAGGGSSTVARRPARRRWACCCSSVHCSPPARSGRWCAGAGGAQPTMRGRGWRPGGGRSRTPRATSGIGWDDQVTLRTTAGALEQGFGDPADRRGGQPPGHRTARRSTRRRPPHCTGWSACSSGPASPAHCRLTRRRPSRWTPTSRPAWRHARRSGTAAGAAGALAAPLAQPVVAGPPTEVDAHGAAARRTRRRPGGLSGRDREPTREGTLSVGPRAAVGSEAVLVAALAPALLEALHHRAT